MARELKLRAWDKTTQRMYEIVRLDWESGEVYLRGENDDYGFAVPWDTRIIIMQYTSLKDKNGVEIYEGDITRFHIDTPSHWMQEVYMTNGHTIKQVVWREGKYHLDGKDAHGDVLNWRTTSKANDLEVICNIYENPELLEAA